MLTFLHAEGARWAQRLPASVLLSLEAQRLFDEEHLRLVHVEMLE